MIKHYIESENIYFDESDYDHSLIPIIGFGIQFIIALTLGCICLIFSPFPKIFMNLDNPITIVDMMIAMILQMYSTAILISFILEVSIVHPIVSYCMRKKNIVPEKIDFTQYLRWGILILFAILILHR